MRTRRTDPPACWRWKIPDQAFCDRLRRRLAAESPRFAAKLTEEDWRWELMCAWQRGRCAICGRRGRALVRDHDHETWLIRGLLCQYCNMTEAHLPKYGAINPALICGVRQEYYSSWPGAMLRPAPPDPPQPVCRPPSYSDAEVVSILALGAIWNAETVTAADLRSFAGDDTGLLVQAAGRVVTERVRRKLAERVAAVRLFIEAGADESLIGGWPELKAQADPAA